MESVGVVDAGARGALVALLAGSDRLLGELTEAADCPSWMLGGAEVEQLLGVVAAARHQLDRIEVALTAEGVARGLHTDGGYSAVDWLARCEAAVVPAPPVHQLAQVERLARAARRTAAVADAEDDGELTPEEQVLAQLARVCADFEAGRLSRSKADTLVRFHEETTPVADPEVLAEVLAALTEAASDTVTAAEADEATQDADDGDDGPPEREPGITDRDLGAAIRRARPIVKPAKDIDEDQERARRGRRLMAAPAQGEMTEYRWLLEPAAAAVVDAAVSALSAPQPGEDGSPDPRPAAHRRADALMDLVERGMGTPTSTLPASSPVQVVVTISLEDLVAQTPATGTTATGMVLSAQEVRRMACDAEVVPMVLGSRGEVLDLGRSVRLFTPGQRRALWQRDGGCSFPGCTVPPAWCRAHHVVWWSRGGATDIGNAALLCQRHHSYVHLHDLHATVTPTGVTWHLPPGLATSRAGPPT